MGWAALITMLIQVFGPILIEWLKKWLESRLSAAAEKLPAFATYGSEHEARDAMFNQAIADLPRLAFARRAMLRRMKAAAATAGVTSTDPGRVSSDDLVELVDLAGAANDE